MAIETGNLVRLLDIDSDFIIDLRYATPDNFTGQRIYDFDECYIDRNTAHLLIKARDKFKALGFRVKVWDAYRPLRAQRRFWEIMPDPNYIAEPPVITNETKYRPTHMNGLCVDITLTDLYGKEIDMPSGYDDFTGAARLDCPSAGARQKSNATLLKDIMESAGFMGYEDEWWHFYDVTSPVTPFSDYLLKD